ncbi:2-dehydro-3-deoxyphosphooctonate aldolase (KDO 8-P synthase) [Paenibacillus sp. LBL]|uniref:3-deoxy-8-phosphooctulonate synthase n=1 Tax=Paenibacillus sp. LBL TaxID=2940563 RepID=UPI0024732C45|nr:3-deoxy-8-phosphooctulonate synthase [Paenibacillus sp. LBL]MDH6674546.1 2-dehydro-3-deoxyphosphooctonate aldolase (KDO 8-P synthase) [Paenibacillus sp. LBL]
MRTVNVSKTVSLSNHNNFALFGGPCVIESEYVVMHLAEKIKDITTELQIPYVFKASFDKANRSSGSSFRGQSMEEGLKILRKVKETFELPVVTDIHESYQAEPVAEVADVLQIPAYLCRQTDLLVSAAKTGRTINVKKGQFLAPWDMTNIVKKVEEAGNYNICLTERGTSFGYNNLVVDYRGLEIMKGMDYPVIFDATHSVQIPGGNGTSSGGQREYVPTLSKAAISVGVAALFMEIHHDPDNALSDGPNMVPLHELKNLLERLQQYDKITKGSF